MTALNTTTTEALHRARTAHPEHSELINRIYEQVLTEIPDHVLINLTIQNDTAQYECAEQQHTQQATFIAQSLLTPPNPYRGFLPDPPHDIPPF